MKIYEFLRHMAPIEWDLLERAFDACGKLEGISVRGQARVYQYAPHLHRVGLLAIVGTFAGIPATYSITPAGVQLVKAFRNLLALSEFNEAAARITRER